MHSAHVIMSIKISDVIISRPRANNGDKSKRNVGNKLAKINFTPTQNVISKNERKCQDEKASFV